MRLGISSTHGMRGLRGAGFRCTADFQGRSMKAQMKAADRAGALLALIVGPDELADGTVAVRDLEGGDQTVVARSEVLGHVGSRLS